jgi:hypothetical protein
MFGSEEQPTLMAEIEDFSDLLEAREMELEEIHEYDTVEEVADDVPEALVEENIQERLAEEIEEFEEIEVIEEIEEIEELEFEPDEEAAFESATPEHADFLEPSPILIEPEYEPADVAPPSSAKGAPSASNGAGTTYEIELVQVGENTERIIEFLSKVKGLPASPDKIVQAVPTIITKDAKETDAKNFQILMQKLGAKVRLIKH